MERKFKVTVICGTEAVRSAEEEWYMSEDEQGKQEWLEDHEDDLAHRFFNTEEEADAYIKGIDDATGWLETIVLKEKEEEE